MPSLLSSSHRSSRTLSARGESGTPSRSTRHNGSNNNRSNNESHRATTPEYEPQCTPLTGAGQRALAALFSNSSFRQLKAHMQQVSEKVAETAGDANERVTYARSRFEKTKEKEGGKGRKGKKRKNAGRDEDGDRDDEERETDDDEEEEESDADDDMEEESDGNDEGDNSEARKLAVLEEKVKHVTQQLEARMRGVVDAEYKLTGLQSTVESVHKEIEAATAAAEAARRRNGLRNRGVADEDEEMADADEVEEDEPPIIAPTQVLQDKLSEHDSQWERQSLTQRYTKHNGYINFYRVVHDAKYPGDDIPPVPHPSRWFSHLESNRTSTDGSASPAHGRIRSQSAGDEEDDEDDEVAIERERISLLCPLTLRTFEDPVKSTKCVHSFEREAIQDLIRHSSMTVPAGEHDFQAGGQRSARARRVHAVQCPVCSVALTLNDLKPDPVLLRRVRRARAMEQREEEEAEFDSVRRRKGGRKSGFTIASDEEEDEDEDEVDDDDNTDDDNDNISIDDGEEESRATIKSERLRVSSRTLRDVDEISDD